ncbi:MAG: transglycosylase SLT domain-containing protein [Kosmotogaceae bacterium]
MVFLIIIASIAGLITLFVFNSFAVEKKEIRTIAIIYNRGTGADYKSYLNNPSYSYDEKVYEYYNYFATGAGTPSPLPGGVKLVDKQIDVVFESDQNVERFASRIFTMRRPKIKERMDKLINMSSSLNMYDQETKDRISQTIYQSIMNFSGAEVPINVGGNRYVLKLSTVKPELVLAILAVESGFNPLAYAREVSINPDLSNEVYSRGIAQIYEFTLWSMNNWLEEANCNIKVDELWSIRNSIFLSMVYLAYADIVIYSE